MKKENKKLAQQRRAVHGQRGVGFDIDRLHQPRMSDTFSRIFAATSGLFIV